MVGRSAKRYRIFALYFVTDDPKPSLRPEKSASKFRAIHLSIAIWPELFASKRSYILRFAIQSLTS